MYGRVDNETILKLWRAGLDTNQIAKATWEHEYTIANRLPDVLQRARQDEEWEFKSVGEANGPSTAGDPSTA